MWILEKLAGGTPHKTAQIRVPEVTAGHGVLRPQCMAGTRHWGSCHHWGTTSKRKPCILQKLVKRTRTRKQHSVLGCPISRTISMDTASLLRHEENNIYWIRKQYVKDPNYLNRANIKSHLELRANKLITNAHLYKLKIQYFYLLLNYFIWT